MQRSPVNLSGSGAAYPSLGAAPMSGWRNDLRPSYRQITRAPEAAVVGHRWTVSGASGPVVDAVHHHLCREGKLDVSEVSIIPSGGYS